MFKQILELQAGPLLIVLKYYTELAKALIWHFSCLRHGKYSRQMIRSICKLRLKWAWCIQAGLGTSSKILKAQGAVCECTKSE